MYYPLDTENLVREEAAPRQLRIGREDDVGIDVEVPMLSVREVDEGGLEQAPTMNHDALAAAESLARRSA